MGLYQENKYLYYGHCGISLRMKEYFKEGGRYLCKSCKEKEQVWQKKILDADFVLNQNILREEFVCKPKECFFAKEKKKTGIDVLFGGENENKLENVGY